jgi:hypothetical protein
MEIAKPGYKDSLQLVLMKRKDAGNRAVKLEAVTEGKDWKSEEGFEFKFSSHPGMGVMSND